MKKFVKKLTSENRSLNDGFKDYKDFFEKISKEKVQLEEKNQYYEEMIESKKQEFTKSNAMIQCLKSENEKLRKESEILIKRTEDKLKIGQNALDSIERYETEIFELKCKLTNISAELEALKKNQEKTVSLNYETTMEMERLKINLDQIEAELIYGKKLWDENGDLRRKLKNMKE